jgi:CRISPR-associated protein Csd2
MYIVDNKNLPTDNSNVIVVDDLSKPVDRYLSGLGLFSVTNSNPQGDLDAENRPRQNPFTQKGFFTPQGLTRKIRDLVSLKYGLPIHVKRGGVLIEETNEATQKRGKDPKAKKVLADVVAKQKASKKAKKAEEEKAPSVDSSSVMRACTEEFFDDRVFGRLFTSPVNDHVTGPLQISMAQSLHPIEVVDLAITCVAVSNFSEKEKKDNNIGRTSVVNFGLYAWSFTLNPIHAKHTGCSWNDVNILLDILPRVWDLTQSCTRTGVAHEGLYVFEHADPYTSAPVHRLNNLVRPKAKDDEDVAKHSMEDYRLIQQEDVVLPPGVRLIVL